MSTSPEAAPAPAVEEEDLSDDGGRRKFFTLFPSIMLPMFLAIVDQTIVATALPAIASDFSAVERISWVVISYLVATTIAAPVYGRLGDALGRRRLMFVALGIFMVASLVCTAAVSLGMLVAGRVLQGLGGGGLMTLSQALIGEAVPPRSRARFQGYLAGVAVTSSIFGPVAGGYLTEFFGWRSIFLVNIPLGILAALMVFRIPARRGEAALGRFDMAGLVLFALFVASFLVMLEQAQKLDISNLWLTLGLAAFSLIAVAALVLRELRTPDPLFPVPVFRHPAIWRSDMLAACHGAVLVSLVTYIPIYLRVARGATASEIGVFLLPMMAAVGVGSMTTGQLVSRTGYTSIFPSIGLIFALAGIVALALLGPDLGDASLGVLLALIALFLGTVMSVVQVTVQTAAGRGLLGTAAASVQFSRSLGAALGTAIVGAVLFAALVTIDPEATRVFIALFQSASDPLVAMPAAKAALISAEIARAFKASFLAMACFVAIANLLAWTIPLKRI